MEIRAIVDRAQRAGLELDLTLIWGSLKREVTSKHLSVELSWLVTNHVVNRAPVSGERRSRYLPGPQPVVESESRPLGRLGMGFMEHGRLRDARAAARRAWREAEKRAA